MNQYQRHFTTTIWQRGQQLQQKQAVYNLQKTENGYDAMVSGNYDDYYVSVEFDNKKNIEFLSCTCPYAEQGHNCKHMAALLIEVCEQDNYLSYNHWQDVFDQCVENHQIVYFQERTFQNEMVKQIIQLKVNSLSPQENLKTALEMTQALMQLNTDFSIITNLSAQLMTFFHWLLQADSSLSTTLSHQLKSAISKYPASLMNVYLLQFLNEHKMLSKEENTSFFNQMHEVKNENALNYLLQKNIDLYTSEQLMEYAQYESIQPQLVKLLYQEQKYEEAIPLLQRLTKNKHIPYNQKEEYFKQLNHIYLITQNKQEYRKTLLFAIKNAHHDLKQILKNYKSMFTQEEWQKEIHSLEKAILGNYPRSDAHKIYYLLNDSIQLFRFLYETYDLTLIQDYRDYLYQQDPENYLMFVTSMLIKNVENSFSLYSVEKHIRFFLDLFEICDHAQDHILDALILLRERNKENDEIINILDEVEEEYVY